MSLSSINSTRLRMTGLNSGMDTESIIANLMKAERLSVNKVYRNRTKSEWKLENYTKVNSDLLSFSNKYLSALSKDSIVTPSTYMSYTANYKENSYFKVKGSAGVIPGNYKVTSTVMATYAQATGAKGASQRTQVVGSVSNYLRTNVESGELKIADGSVATGSTTLGNIVNADGKSAFGFTDEAELVSFTVNGTSIDLNKNDTIDQAITKINGKLGTGMAASFDATTGKISFNSSTNAQFTFANINGTVFGDKGGFNGITQGLQPQELGFKTSDSLKDIAAAGGPDFLGGGSSLSFTIDVGGTSRTFSFSENDSLDDIMNAVNGSTVNGNGFARMTLDDRTGEFVVRSVATNSPITVTNGSGKMFGDDSAIGIKDQTISTVTTISSSDTINQVASKMGVDLQLDSNGKFSFTINGKSFSFDKNTSMNEVMTAVNGSDANVRMYYSELQDAFVFSSTNIGADGKVDLGNTGGTNAFGSNGIFGIADGDMSSTGTNASITINGNTVTKSSNNFTIDGMQFELTENFTAAADESDAVNITFTQDIDGAVEKVKAFIEEYNKLIEDLSGMIKEKKHYDYYPLLPEEEEGLTEKEIEKWTEKAKSGIMRNDVVISGLLSNLRSAAYAIVGDTGMMAAEIGITTGGGTNGTLKLDEKMLREALADNPNKVAQVMTNTSKATDPEQKYAESGFAVRLSSVMSQYRTNTRANQIQDETEKIRKFDDKIKDMEKKLLIKEERYWAQYSQLETMMGNLNNQSNWLTAQLSALGGQ